MPDPRLGSCLGFLKAPSVPTMKKKKSHRYILLDKEMCLLFISTVKNNTLKMYI